MSEATRPTRHFDLEGTYNIRDVGGYEARDGATIRWRMLLRADGLHRLPPSSQAALVDSGLRTIVDLRGSAELARERDVFADSDKVDYRHHNLMGDELMAEFAARAVGEGRAEYIAGMYKATLDRRQAEIAETISVFAQPGALPGLFHCTGGKDRTGIVAAFVLGLCGVSNDTIIEDYALSGYYLFARHLAAPVPGDVSAGIETWQDYRRMNCPPEAMSMTLEHLECRYGGPEAYLLGGGATKESLDALRDAILD